MPAGILATDEMMYANRALPWHRLGNPIGEENLHNIAAVRAAAGLDWRVIEVAPTLPIQGEEFPMNAATYDEFGAVTRNEGYRAILRDDLYGTEAILNVVKGRYRMQQNDVVLDLAASISDEDEGVKFETAGSLRGGRTVWALARLGDDPRLDGLNVERYIMVVKSHDSTSPIKVIPTNVRVVCANTLAIANKKEALFTIKHTRHADDRIAEAKLALTAMYSTHDALAEEIYQLMNTTVTNAEFDSIMGAVFNPKGYDEGKGLTQTNNRIAEARYSYNNPDNTSIKGTGWGLVNSVNDVEVWASAQRGLTRDEQQMSRVVNNFQPLTQKARDLVLA